MVDRNGGPSGRGEPSGLTERLLAACHDLSAHDDPEQVERRLPRLALEVTGAGAATLAVLDGRQQGFARLLSTRGDGPQTPFDGVQERELLASVHAARTIERPPRAEDVVTTRVVSGPGAVVEVLVAPLVDRGWLEGWLSVASGAGEQFGPDARRALALLVRWAGMALSNARLVADARTREIELVRAVRTLGAAGRIAESVTREPRLERVLDRIVGEASALVEARFMLAFLVEGDDLVVVAQAGDLTRDVRGMRLPRRGGTLLSEVLDGGQPRAVDTLVRRALWTAGDELGEPDQSGLLVPMLFRGRRVGMLLAIERLHSDDGFDDEAVRLLQSFAAGASSAVSSARSIEEDRLRRTLAATEQERRRWARELHDETLQDLGLLRIELTRALTDRGADLRGAMQGAVDGLADEITRLRGLINELRPAMLDELGLEPALQALVERARRGAAYPIEVTIDLGGQERLRRDVEMVAYRVTQEGLTNTAKHAQPQRVSVTVARGSESLEVSVSDDGVGFDPASANGGFGLIGMRERVALAGGSLAITSSRGYGTRVEATLPLPPRAEP